MTKRESLLRLADTLKLNPAQYKKMNTTRLENAILRNVTGLKKITRDVDRLSTRELDIIARMGETLGEEKLRNYMESRVNSMTDESIKRAVEISVKGIYPDATPNDITEIIAKINQYMTKKEQYYGIVMEEDANGNYTEFRTLVQDYLLDKYDDYEIEDF